MLTFVSFLWRQPGYHTAYGAEHVRRWAAMIRKHYRAPRRIVLVTDQPGDFGDIETLPLWDDFGGMVNPHGPALPSCFRRLRIWTPDAAELFGERLVLMDLDCSILGDLEPLLDRREDVVLWRDPSYPIQPYNGGMILLRTGSRPRVWTEFRGEESAREAHARGFKGSDQAWIAHALGRNEAVWTAEADGVVSWKKHLRRGLPRPSDRVVMFHGVDKPWHSHVPAVFR